MIDSNYNNTEVPADLREEQALQLSVKDYMKESGSSSTLKQYNENTTEQFNFGRSRIFFRINFHKYNTGLTIVGNYAW